MNQLTDMQNLNKASFLNEKLPHATKGKNGKKEAMDT